ncbi:MAG: DNA primase, partial [Thermoplasmata archaeon]|nr:DNA primase [Thermoplasmata archaeon]
AIFGQTEGLLGDELDLRDLQKSGRMGRIEVSISSERGKSSGEVRMPSSLDQVETCILASALETIDRVGPCKAKIKVDTIEDVRQVKKKQIVERAKELLAALMEESKTASGDLTASVREAIQVEEIVSYGKDKSPAGPNVSTSDAIIVVEGRSDVLNLLKFGIKNAIAVEGTNVPPTIKELASERVVTAFVDGDRGGELILRELLQTIELDFVTRAPRNREVEELTQKQIIKALRNKVPLDQYVEMYGLSGLVPKEDLDMTPAKDSRSSRKDWKEKDRGKEPKAERAREPKAERAREPKEPMVEEPKIELTKDQEQYVGILKKLSGRLKANIINPKGEIIQELDVKDLTSTLKGFRKKVKAVVFDGVITQRLLDIAVEKEVADVAGK